MNFKTYLKIYISFLMVVVTPLCSYLYFILAKNNLHDVPLNN